MHLPWLNRHSAAYASCWAFINWHASEAPHPFQNAIAFLLQTQQQEQQLQEQLQALKKSDAKLKRLSLQVRNTAQQLKETNVLQIANTLPSPLPGLHYFQISISLKTIIPPMHTLRKSQAWTPAHRAHFGKNSWLCTTDELTNLLHLRCERHYLPFWQWEWAVCWRRSAAGTESSGSSGHHHIWQSRLLAKAHWLPPSCTWVKPSL